MKFKLNPLTGEFDYTSDSANKEKLNPMTGEFNLVEGDGPFSQIFNPLTGTFNLLSGGVSGGEGIIQVVLGNGYIDLTDAVANQLKYLKVYGGTKQGDLPSEYTQLEYIQGDGESYLIVPYIVNNKTVFYARYNEVQNGPQTANVIFGVTNTPSTNAAYYGILRLTGARIFNRMGWGDNTVGSVIDVPTAPKEFNTWYEVLYDQNKLYQDGTLYATSATDPDTVWSANYDLGIFARNGSSVTMPAVVKISSVWAKENNEYKLNLVPAKRNSDNVLGMYDTVTGNFLTNQGTGTFTAGPDMVPAPATPISITCNNGTFGYKVISDNKFDTDHTLIDLGHYYTANGGEYSDSATNFILTKKIPVTPGEKYVFYGRQKEGDRMSSYNRIHFFAEDGTFLLTGTCPAGRIGTGTAPANSAYALLSCNPSGENADSGTPCTIEYIDSYNWTFKVGTSEGTFEPFEGGLDFYGTVETVEDELNNTAIAENLFAIGDIKDVQEVLSGRVTRNIGIKVLDGTESWTRGSDTDASGNRVFYTVFDDRMTGSTVTALCSHFQKAVNASYSTLTTGTFLFNGTSTAVYFDGGAIDTLANWKQWLYDQYIAGTPVVVIYPLATPTTETVAGQTMNVQEGDNRIEITQASIDNLHLEAKYLQSN